MLRQIINKIADESLLPLSFKQLGNTRSWIRDQGAWLIVITFDSSSHEKGVSMDMGLNFLWNSKSYVSYDFSISGNPRTINFISYISDEQFEKDLGMALEKVLPEIKKYIEIKDLPTLLKIIGNKEGNAGWLWFHRSVMEGLVGEYDLSIKHFKKLVEEDLSSVDIPWIVERAKVIKTYIDILENNPTTFIGLINEKVKQGKGLLGIGVK